MISDCDIVVLYGSETGNAEDLAFKLQNDFKSCGKECVAMSVSQYPPNELQNQKIVIFLISTSGDGEMVIDMKEFWKHFLQKKLTSTYLSNTNIAIFGLGDSGYEKFNAAARKVNVRFKQLGAQEILPIALGDDQAGFGVYSAFEPWVTKLWEKLEITHGNFGDSGYQSKISPYQVTTNVSNLGVANVASLLKHLHSFPSITSPSSNAVPVGVPAVTMVEPKIMNCRIVSNTRVTSAHWHQDIRHIEIEIPGSELGPSGNGNYFGGDIATIYPENDDSVVVQLLKLLIKRDGSTENRGELGLETDEKLLLKSKRQMVNIVGTPARPVTKFRLLGKHRVKKETDSVLCSLYTLLKHVLDFQGTPRRSFFEYIAHFAEDEVEKEKLMEIASPEGTDLYYDYCVRESRNYGEILEEFGSIRYTHSPGNRGTQESLIPVDFLGKLLETVPVIQPRMYSIASSSVASGAKLNLCVGIVKYKTRYGRNKAGLCSQFLENCATPRSVFMGIHKGSYSTLYPYRDAFTATQNVTAANASFPPTPPSSFFPGIPIILVGPGTGVAPMRALIQERSQYMHGGSAETPDIHTLLFYGCRKYTDDCLYKNEWLQYANDISENGVSNKDLRVGETVQSSASGVYISVAFSQEKIERQPDGGKTYVIHKIKSNSELVWNLIQKGAIIFVAGSAKRMPIDVRKAFISVIAKHMFGAEGNNDIESLKEAEKYFVMNLERKKRYIVEAWS